jgi:hypothetical protein
VYFGRHACGDVPWKQLLDAVDGVIGDARQHVPQIRFRGKAIQLGSADQTVDCGGAFTAGIRSCEQVFLSTRATVRNARSAALLSISMRPSST